SPVRRTFAPMRLAWWLCVLLAATACHGSDGANEAPPDARKPTCTYLPPDAGEFDGPGCGCAIGDAACLGCMGSSGPCFSCGGPMGCGEGHFVVQACDGPEDCMPGQVCCGVSCVDAAMCSGEIACHKAADCPANQACCNGSFLSRCKPMCSPAELR